MSTPDTNRQDTGSTHIIVWVVIILVVLILVGGFLWLRKSAPAPNSPEASLLQSAIRPGSPDWNNFHDKIVLDKPYADESKRALGDWVMTLHTNVRNFTGRTLVGLEMHAAVVDLERKPVKERTVVIIPTRVPDLDNNKTLPVSIPVEGMKDSDVRADITMEVTGFILK